MKVGDDYHIVKRKEAINQPVKESRMAKFENWAVGILFVYLMGHVLYALNS